MLDIREVDQTIKELENGKTTFDTCAKLADMYIIRKYFATSKEMQEESGYGNPDVKKELRDILPSYREFCDLKKHYKNGEISEKPVLNALDKMCTEIYEFMMELYEHTDMQQEKEALEDLIKDLHDNIKISSISM